MYRTYQIDVYPDHPMFEYFEKLSVASTNMYNTALFVCRQVMFGVNKVPDQRQVNEKMVLKQIEDALPLMQATRKKDDVAPYVMPEKGKSALSYSFLNSFFHVTHNAAYEAEGFPRKCAQQTLKQVCQDMRAFYASLRAYRKNSAAFLGKPKPPNYKKKGRGSTFTMTNQTCLLKQNDNGECVLQFPMYNGKKQLLPLGGYVQNDWILKQATVVPFHGILRLRILFDDGKTAPEIIAGTGGSKRICAIDLGVTNFAAMSNNIGKPAMLIKGGVINNANHHCTRQVGKLQSQQTNGTTTKLKSTKRVRQLLINRDNFHSDYVHKSAKVIINWCTENSIDTLVVGNNALWKQNVNIGGNTGKFELLPYERFKSTLEYLCARTGILFVRQEESYTSKASFLDSDVIPVYEPGDTTCYTFSGTRSGRLYKTNSGITVNADINGSANIGRKAFPDLFTVSNCDILSPPVVFRHPDHGLMKTTTL